MTAIYGDLGTCRAATCRAQFQWTETEKRRRMPVDLEPAELGNIRLRPGGAGVPPTAIVLAGRDLAEARAAGEALYLSHFATCPARKGFRRA